MKKVISTALVIGVLFSSAPAFAEMHHHKKPHKVHTKAHHKMKTKAHHKAHIKALPKTGMGGASN